MNDTDVDVIEARANAATPGPWEYRMLGGSNREEPEPPEYWCIVPLPDGSEHVIAADQYPGDGRDIAFIAAARTDVPLLCALVRRLRTESMWRCICGSGGNNIADVAHHLATCSAVARSGDAPKLQGALAGFNTWASETDEGVRVVSDLFRFIRSNVPIGDYRERLARIWIAALRSLPDPAPTNRALARAIADAQRLTVDTVNDPPEYEDLRDLAIDVAALHSLPSVPAELPLSLRSNFVLGCEHGLTKRHWVLESGKVPAHWCPGPLGPAPDGEVPQTFDEADVERVARAIASEDHRWEKNTQFATQNVRYWHLDAARAALRSMKGAEQ